jgi:hypothetical protein
VTLIMARVPEGTRRFRLPSPRVQLSDRNLAPDKLPFQTFLRGLSRGCFKTRFIQERSGLQASKRTKFVGPMRAKVHPAYQMSPRFELHGQLHISLSEL